jgi:hypothetical protein
MGKLIETWETTNKTFKVRVNKYAEESGGFVAGAYYAFESTRVVSDKWKEFMIIHHDDPDPIPHEQVRFVNDQVGYVFMVYKYAVTTDSGDTWALWDIVKDLPDWQRSRAAIKEVQIAPDGSGKMILTPFTNQPAPELHTKDYGRHWSVE